MNEHTKKITLGKQYIKQKKYFSVLIYFECSIFIEYYYILLILLFKSIINHNSTSKKKKLLNPLHFPPKKNFTKKFEPTPKKIQHKSQNFPPQKHPPTASERDFSIERRNYCVGRVRLSRCWKSALILQQGVARAQHRHPALHPYLPHSKNTLTKRDNNADPTPTRAFGPSVDKAERHPSLLP